MYLQELYKQLALDYCLSAEQVADDRNYFTEHRMLDGCRRFDGQENCRLKVVAVGGKLLFCGQKEIVEECRKKYETWGGDWFMDMGNFRVLDEILKPYGAQVRTVHPFFLPVEERNANETGDDGRAELIGQIGGARKLAESFGAGYGAKTAGTNYEIVTYSQQEILQFRGDDRFDEAFCFSEEAPDMLGVAAVKDGNILGMAGASGDSPYFWQIGINVAKEAEGMHIGSTLVTVLKNKVLEQGKVPYYGAAMSNIASQRLAANAGFRIAWVELLAD